jgi:hypothetical protein
VTAAAKQALDKAKAAVADAARQLSRADYRKVLEELADEIEARIQCLAEEDK